MRLLTFSTLFPDAARPNHGVFVENRLRHLVASGEASSTVLAPVPRFPTAHPRVGAYATFARIPAHEQRHGLTIHHPRYLTIPRFGMSAAPFLLYAAARQALAKLIRDGLQFDLIDAHYIYPDGVAAIWLGKTFNKPVTLTARGSDVTELPDYALPHTLIRRALRDADHLIGVSSALCARMIELGADPSKVTTLRNGVDTHHFHPVDRPAARASLGLTRKTLISVGHLIPRKRNHLTIAALALLPDFDLLLVGDGPERGSLEAQAKSLRLATAIRDLFQTPPDRTATRTYAEPFSWDATTAGQLKIFRDILSRA